MMDLILDNALTIAEAVAVALMFVILATGVISFFVSTKIKNLERTMIRRIGYRQFSTEFKIARVLDVYKGGYSLEEVAVKHRINIYQLKEWEAELLMKPRSSEIF